MKFLAMMMAPPGLLLGLGVVLFGLSLNVLRPLRRPAVLSAASFFAGWLAGEMALHQLVLQGLAVGGLIALGALGRPEGRVGLGLTALAWAGLVRGLGHSPEGGTLTLIPGRFGHTLIGQLVGLGWTPPKLTS